MKIQFIPDNEYAEKIFNMPEPSKNFVPKWYKEMNLFIEKKDKKHGIAINNRFAPNTTIKACSPFSDALFSGYIWSLPADIEIRKFQIENQKEISFRWRTHGPDLISEHSLNQHPGMPSLINGELFVMKWSFNFIIKTPPGYSTLFTHPLNRHDLPFRTFSGVVDTDTYTQSIQFPFQIYDFKEEILILEKGTPVCQFVPFKRDNWSSKKEKYNKDDVEKKSFNFKSKIVRSYKNQFWNKKEYN